MNLIPRRKKHGIPIVRETGLSAPLSEFRHEMDRLFNRFFHGSLLEPGGWSDEHDWPIREFVPTVDVAENDKEITIRAEVPGMDPENIDITVSGNVLTMHGEKKETTEDRKNDFYHCERRFGSFTRSMELPASADFDHIEAEQCNGVLTIRVKKLAMARSKKKIDVKPAHRALAGTSN